MDVREKLVELIGSTEYGNGSLVGKNFQKGFIEKIASNLIAHGVTVQEWISVDEKLPSDCNQDWVLAFVVEDNGYKWIIPKVAEYRKGLDDWYVESVGWPKKDHNGAFIVTHWMPLPEPPKGE